VIVYGNLGRIGVVDQVSGAIAWICAPEQVDFRAACAISDTVILGDDAGSIWRYQPDGSWIKGEPLSRSPITSLHADRKYLYASTYSGEIYQLKTSQYNSAIHVYDGGLVVTCLAGNDSTLLAVGEKGHIVVSHDGGGTWTNGPAPVDTLGLTCAQALDDGSWLIGGEGARVIILDKTARSVLRQYQLFPPYDRSIPEGMQRPDVVTGIARNIDGRIAITVNGYRVRMSGLHFEALYFYDQVTDTWKGVPYIETIDANRPLPTQRTVGLYWIDSLSAVGVTSGGLNRSNYLSLQRAARSDTISQIVRYSLFQGREEPTEQGPGLTTLSASHADACVINDTTAILLTQWKDEYSGFGKKGQAVTEMIHATVSRSSVRLQTRQVDQQFVRMEMLGTKLVAYDTGGVFFSSTDTGRTFTRDSHYPSEIFGVSTFASAQGIAAIKAYTRPNTDSLVWKNGVIFLSRDEGDTWVRVVWPSITNSVIYPIALAAGGTGHVAALLEIVDTTTSVVSFDIYQWSSDRDVPRIIQPPAKAVPPATKAYPQLAFVGDDLTILTSTKLSDDQPYSAARFTLSGEDWSATVPVWLNDKGEPISLAGWCSWYQGDAKVQSTSWEFYEGVSVDGGATFAPLQQHVATADNISGAVILGEHALIYGNSNVLMVARVPSTTSMGDRGILGSGGRTVMMPVGTRLQIPNEAGGTTVSLYSSDGRMITRREVGMDIEYIDSADIAENHGLMFCLVHNATGEVVYRGVLLRR